VEQVEHLMRPSDEKIIFGSTDKLRRHTGWTPVLSIEETLTSMLSYWDSSMSDAASGYSIHPSLAADAECNAVRRATSILQAG
jgi:hypothetical protein